jgi:hypothetical protein
MLASKSPNTEFYSHETGMSDISASSLSPLSIPLPPSPSLSLPPPPSLSLPRSPLLSLSLPRSLKQEFSKFATSARVRQRQGLT